VSERKTIETGRNLPVALAVAAVLGGLVLVTLLTAKTAFLILVAVIIGVALWELGHAVAAHQIKLHVIPVGVGGTAAYALAYWRGPESALAALALTFIVLLAWRLPHGTRGYLSDVTAGVFALVYLFGMATFVALMLAAKDGAHRALAFVILAVCSDSGAYFAGILFGQYSSSAPPGSARAHDRLLSGTAILGRKDKGTLAR